MLSKLNLRLWATPLTIGAFVLLAVTGILMFFHWDTGLNKTAHEWLGWALAIGGLAHLTMHVQSVKKHLQKPLGGAIIGLFIILLGLSFISLGQKGGGNPAKAVIEGLSAAPIATLAPLAHTTPEGLAATLQNQGFAIQNPATDTIQTLTAGNREKPAQILKIIFPATK